jgi:hypothetical protein
METNPQDYDRRASWIPQQNQRYEGRVATPQYGRQQLTRPQSPGQPQHVVGLKPRAPQKMPKTRVLALANTLKRWLAIASIVGFGTFGGLVALHQVGTTATTTTTRTSSTSSQTSSSQANKNFLKQGGNNVGSTKSSQTATSTATPVTSSSTS